MGKCCFVARAAWASGRLALVSAVLLTAQCGGTSPIFPTPPSTGPSAAPVLVGAGDIGYCQDTAIEATARLLDAIDGTVFTAGDNIYGGTSLENYSNCYGPTWGRHLARTKPSPGNHDYDPPGPAAYFQYFAEAAGFGGRGFYSYEVAGWHVLSLNSMIPIESGSLQLQWVASVLSSHRVPCTVVYWHHPLFSSGQNGPSPFVRDLWRVLYQYGVDVVINGHDHLYERFAPQDSDGRSDPARGVRQFTVGTGGAPLYAFTSIQPNSEARASVHGVIKLTLETNSYTWEFVPIAGGSFRDSGTGACR